MRSNKNDSMAITNKGQEAGARLLLKQLSRADNGLTRDQLLAIYIESGGSSNLIEADHNLSLVLKMIEHDGYILRTTDGRRRFRSPQLRKWWFNNFVI